MKQTPKEISEAILANVRPTPSVSNSLSEQEKIDIITYAEDTKTFISNALSPAEIAKIEIEENADPKRAKVFVSEDQQSIAIGRGGQNVRLASKLTGYELDITPLVVAAAPKAEKKPRKNIEDELFSAIEETSTEQ